MRSCTQSELQLRTADAELIDLRRACEENRSQLERTRADAEYLRSRAQGKPRPKPRLSYVEALNLSVSASAMEAGQ